VKRRDGLLNKIIKVCGPTAILWRDIRDMGLKLHVFITLALNGSEYQLQTPAALSPEKQPRKEDSLSPKQIWTSWRKE
jgi:hypothetical protein